MKITKDKTEQLQNDLYDTLDVVVLGVDINVITMALQATVPGQELYVIGPPDELTKVHEAFDKNKRVHCCPVDVDEDGEHSVLSAFQKHLLRMAIHAHHKCHVKFLLFDESLYPDMDDYLIVFSDKTHVDEKWLDKNDYYQSLQATLTEWIDLYAMFAWTGIAHSKEMLAQHIINTPRICKTYDYNQFKFHGPIVLCLSGPSLMEAKELIKIATQRKAYVVCAGTAYIALRKYNIMPDAICVIDSFEENDAHYLHLDVPETIAFWFGPKVRYTVPEYFDGHVQYWHDDMSRYLKHAIGKDVIPEIRRCGSVVHAMLQLAMLAEPSSIYLCGSDLALTGGKSHVAGGSHQSSTYDEDGADIKTVACVDGGMVCTTNLLDGYRFGVEEILSLASNVPPVYNVSQGAAIKGTTHMSLDDALFQFEQDVRKQYRKVSPAVKSKDRMINTRNNLNKILAKTIDMAEAFEKAVAIMLKFDLVNNDELNKDEVVALNRAVGKIGYEHSEVVAELVNDYDQNGAARRIFNDNLLNVIGQKEVDKKVKLVSNIARDIDSYAASVSSCRALASLIRQALAQMQTDYSYRPKF